MVDFITPETETSLWYFWGAARNFSPKDEALTANIVKAAGAIFDEDVQMLERQQQNLLANPERRLLMLNIDAGGVQARRVIDRMISAEQKVRARLMRRDPTLEAEKRNDSQTR